MNDFLEILKSITFKTINNKFFLRRNKISLSKNNAFGNMNIKFSPNLIKTDSSNDINILKKHIKHFFIVMDKNCKNFDQAILLKNIKKTFFNIENLSEDIISGVNGNIDFREIIYFNIHTFKVTNHEILHLSSVENKNHNKYFTPLNEGYTQLLAERYFNENIGKSYPFEVLILKNIENILGRDFLEGEYFKGNFKEALKELNNCESVSNVEDMIINIRQIFEIEQSIKSYSDLEKNIINLQKKLLEVGNILFSCLKNKIKNTDNLIEKLKILNNSNLCEYLSWSINGKLYEFKLIDEDSFLKFKDDELYDKLVIEESNKSI